MDAQMPNCWKVFLDVWHYGVLHQQKCKMRGKPYKASRETGTVAMHREELRGLERDHGALWSIAMSAMHREYSQRAALHCHGMHGEWNT